MFLCSIALLTFSSCGYSDNKQDRIIEMFDSFGYSKNCVILSSDQLVVGEIHYDRDQITYNGRKCNIEYLDDKGFYSYTYDPENMSVELLFTDYETFEFTHLGSVVLLADIANAFFSDNCFWFRTDDPEKDEFAQIYYIWNIDTQTATIADSDDVTREYEYSVNKNRSKDYSFSESESRNRLYVTCNQTGETKEINRSVLNSFEQGKKIRNTMRINVLTSFNVCRVFDRNGDIYFSTYFEVGFLGYPCIYYVVKWNFETEECEYYTSVYFDEYQNSLVDMYIIDENAELEG